MDNIPISEIAKNFEKKGFYMSRDGKAKERGEKYANKKLCFVATDIEFLANLLFRLSNHEECYGVKYSHLEREGMYLGRCFMAKEEIIGKLWRKYKNHPKLMCSVQDDDFTMKFRQKR